MATSTPGMAPMITPPTEPTASAAGNLDLKQGFEKHDNRHARRGGETQFPWRPITESKG